LFLACVTLAAQQQTVQVPTVVSGTTPADRELDGIFSKATAAGTAGDKLGAINLLESALQKVQKDPLLKPRENDVLSRLGKAYVDAQRPADGVRAYQILLENLKEECRPGSAGLDRCADAQYGMGTAQMYKGDFAGATTTLRAAMANYAALTKAGYTGDYRLNKLKLHADAQALLAAALFRTGKKPEAISTFERAIQEFSSVAGDANAPEALRSSARASMKDAQTSLDLLKK
jgi:tetratricopeptide (TPR) repeat protein